MDKNFPALLKDLEDILKGTDVAKLIKNKKINDEAKLLKALNACMEHFTLEQAAIAKVVIKSLSTNS